MLEWAQKYSYLNKGIKPYSSPCSDIKVTVAAIRHSALHGSSSPSFTGRVILAGHSVACSSYLVRFLNKDKNISVSRIEAILTKSFCNNSESPGANINAKDAVLLNERDDKSFSAETRCCCYSTMRLGISS